jgi:DNA ligase-1
MYFKELAKYISDIEQTSSRLTITKLLSNLFSKLEKDEFIQAMYLIQGQVSPKYAPINFGMAEKMAIKAVATASQLDVKQITSLYQKTGDLGNTAQKLREEFASFDERDLTIVEVFDLLKKLATATGDGSQEEKVGVLRLLIMELDPLSVRYVVRIPVGSLRLGFSDMTILDALSYMVTNDKSIRPILQSSYQMYPDLGFIGKLLKEKGVEAVAKIEPHVFTPIIMMRAERLSSGDEIIEKIGPCLVEPKFDGFRLQIHKKGDDVQLFTRGLENATHMYPDIVEGIRKEVHAKNVILEGEAIGFDIQTENFLPFQETVQRKRKYDVIGKAKEIPLKLFVFELLYLEGKSYLNEQLMIRKGAIKKIIGNNKQLVEHTIFVAHDELIDEPKRLEIVFDDAITRGLEGIIAKKLDGIYQPGARGWNWIKFKRSYSSKIDDTIDCVVMGYDYGKGKRHAFGIGAFMVGIYDKENDQYKTLAKIGTGLTDEEWKTLKKEGEKLKTEKKPISFDVDKLMECDVWTNPQIVVEIKADEITRSPVHTAGRVLKATKTGSALEVDTAGYALRFPRLVAFRNDKTPDDATSLHEIEELYSMQFKKVK